MNARALLSWVSVGRIVMFALLGGGVQSSPAATMYPNVITSVSTPL